jgi:transposase
MEITNEQYKKIEKYLPRQRGNVSMSNLQLINAILYVTENGCKWRALPQTYGNWHTIYVRMNRWSKSGVLQRVFEALQIEGIIKIKVEAVCLDSTTVKVHPNGTGALKKEESKLSEDLVEDSQRKFIWSPHLTDRLSAFPCPEEKPMIRRKV